MAGRHRRRMALFWRGMHIAALGPDEACERLGSSRDGLPEAEAARRLREFGPNRVEALPGVPLWRRFAAQFVHFFALILWFAAGLAWFAERAQPGQGMAEMGFAILAVILVNGLFSFWQEYRAEAAVEALRALLPQQATVARGGATRLIDASIIVPGDVVLIEEGDRVPAYCRLIEALGLRVDLSTLTGESLPKARDAQPCGEMAPLRARDLVLAGTTVISGRGRALVHATGRHTEFGRISELTQATGERISPLQREVARLSGFIAALATGLGVAFFLIGQAIGLPFWESLMFAVGIIVANVPEGLLPTVTLALAMATQRMARRNALVRHLPAVEALGCTSVIISDKTGTLTCNRMSVRRLWLPEGATDAHALRVMAGCHTLRRASREGASRCFAALMIALEEARKWFARRTPPG